MDRLVTDAEAAGTPAFRDIALLPRISARGGYVSGDKTIRVHLTSGLSRK
ncbi:hypothetical protein ACH4Q7_24175 [Streptomyces roseolus]